MGSGALHAVVPPVLPPRTLPQQAYAQQQTINCSDVRLLPEEAWDPTEEEHDADFTTMSVLIFPVIHQVSGEHNQLGVTVATQRRFHPPVLFPPRFPTSHILPAATTHCLTESSTPRPGRGIGHHPPGQQEQGRRGYRLRQPCRS